MKLADLVFLLLVVTFLPFNEWLLARTARWKRLAEVIGLGVLKPVTWREGAVAGELPVMERHFLGAAVVAGGIAALAARSIQSSFLFVWASLAFLFCFFAWVAFRWSFNHREAARQLAPVVGYGMVAPWLFLLVEYAPHKPAMLRTAAEELWFIKYVPYTPLELAVWMFVAVVGILVCYYLFAWLLFFPFAYAVLVGLKGCRTLSVYVRRKIGRDAVGEVSAAVQAVGLVYFYWISRHG